MGSHTLLRSAAHHSQLSPKQQRAIPYLSAHPGLDMQVVRAAEHVYSRLANGKLKEVKGKTGVSSAVRGILGVSEEGRN